MAMDFGNSGIVDNWFVIMPQYQMIQNRFILFQNPLCN